MKTKNFLIYGLIAVLIALAFTACPPESNTDPDTDPDTTPAYTEGLGYTLNYDGNSYSVNAGTADINGAVVIPATHPIDGKPVTTIGNNAFRNCTNITSITIPDSVTTIYGAADSTGGPFYGCTSLTSVTFERNGNTKIANANAFLGDLVAKSGGTGDQNRFGTYTTSSPASASSVWTKQTP